MNVDRPFQITETISDTNEMPKQLMKISMERDSLKQKWGITIQGGSDLALTAKIASVKVKIEGFAMINITHFQFIKTLLKS